MAVNALTLNTFAGVMNKKCWNVTSCVLRVIGSGPIRSNVIALSTPFASTARRKAVIRDFLPRRPASH